MIQNIAATFSSKVLNLLHFLQFFALSGFPCPSLMNPSDHFLRTINKDFDKVSTSHDLKRHLHNPASFSLILIQHLKSCSLHTHFPTHVHSVHQDIEEGLDGEKMTTAQAIDTLVNSYKSSAYMEKVTRQIAEIREIVSHTLHTALHS